MKKRLKKLNKSQILTIVSIAIIVILSGVISNYAERETQYIENEELYEKTEKEIETLKYENKVLKKENELYIKLLKINNKDKTK